MGFGHFLSPYDWGRLSAYKKTAKTVPGGMVDLSVGSPVDSVSPTVQRALAGSADASDAHGYPVTYGSKALREAVFKWFFNIRGVDLRAVGADVVPTVGSKEAVALMASLLHLGPGDVVVQPAVSYPTYEIGTQLANAEVLKVVDVSNVDSWEHVPGVKAVWVNSPCNPTGEVLSAARLRKVVEAARHIGAVVLSDECYALLDWEAKGDGQASNESVVSVQASSALSDDVCEGSAKDVLVLYSLSKQSNMAGYRTAVIAGDGDLIREQATYRKQIGEIIPGPVQAAMVAALGDMGAVRAQHDRYRTRLVSLVSALQSYGYEARMPQGALYVWVKSLGRDCWEDMADLAALGIVPSPGEFYGEGGYLRFSVTATDADVDLACTRLKAAEHKA